MTITQKRNIGPRQQRRQKRRKQQRVAFASLVTQAARNMARKYRRQRTKQRGGSLLSSIAGRIANIGQKIFLSEEWTLNQKQ